MSEFLNHNSLIVINQLCYSWNVHISPLGVLVAFAMNYLKLFTFIYMWWLGSGRLKVVYLIRNRSTFIAVPPSCCEKICPIKRPGMNRGSVGSCRWNLIYEVALPWITFRHTRLYWCVRSYVTNIWSNILIIYFISSITSLRLKI